MSEQDFIDNIKSDEEYTGGLLSTMTEYASYIGMMIVTLGFLKSSSPDELIRLNGIITLSLGLALAGLGMYGPDVLAVFHSRGKKYIVMYVFYGARMVRRDIELLDDDLVIEKEEESEDAKPFLLPMEYSDYKVAMNAIGVNFLTDSEIDKKMEDALRSRFNKAKVKAKIPRHVRILEKLLGTIGIKVNLDRVEEEENGEDK